jgi:hypothetical protein
MQVARRFRGIVAVGLFMTIVSAATAKYSGGTGEPNDPYQIATAADLILLGETPEDYDKHFILTADIDLDPNLPGGKVFDRAVIGQVTVVEDPNSLSIVGAPFVGVFDGNDHTISHLTITGGACVGLFGCLDSGAEVRNLAVVDVNITTRGDFLGSLVGCNFGKVAKCHGTGTLSGRYHVGGLVGLNYSGTLTACYSISVVSGVDRVGGLVGHNGTQYRYDRPRGSVTQCYSAGRVMGTRWGTGGLAGSSDAAVTQCYSTSEVSGGIVVGGLVGCNYMTVTQCYSTGSVTGNDMVGGLTGLLGTAEASFWNTGTSGQTTSAGGTGKTTAQMQTASTFLDAGWDFADETANGTEDIWWIDDGKDYPHLSWEPRKYSGGAGEPNDPYRIATAADLILLGETPEDYDKHFVLTADIDLDPNLPGGRVFDRAVIAPDIDPTQDAFQGMAFTGVFDGDGHAISHLRIRGADCVGLFGCIESPAWVGDLGMVDVDVHGSGSIVGGLVGESFHGTIVSSYSNGSVNGTDTVGGLVGNNDAGSIDTSYSSGSVTGKYGVGGLVGWNLWPGRINASCSSGFVNGFGEVGGLVGYNAGLITNSYSSDSVSGTDAVGGFAGRNVSGSISASYSSGSVSGNQLVGGLVGRDTYGNIGSSFWDIQTSGQATSAGGTGKTTAEMHTAQTFLDAGWDFVGETANGTDDTWWIDESKDYPRLWWELTPEN